MKRYFNIQNVHTTESSVCGFKSSMQRNVAEHLDEMVDLQHEWGTNYCDQLNNVKPCAPKLRMHCILPFVRR